MAASATTVTTLDGRLARSERARAAIVDALLDLISAGDLRPSAARIAERAGVSLRSVFQHFSDVESLFAAAADRQTARVAKLIGTVRVDGPFAARLDAFVEQRARLLETVAPVRRAALLLEPFSGEIGSRLRAFRALKAGEVRRVFATELARRPPASRRTVAAALVAASSFDFWHALRVHQGMSRAQSRRVMRQTLAALLEAR